MANYDNIDYNGDDYRNKDIKYYINVSSALLLSLLCDNVIQLIRDLTNSKPSFYIWLASGFRYGFRSALRVDLLLSHGCNGNVNGCAPLRHSAPLGYPITVTTLAPLPLRFPIYCSLTPSPASTVVHAPCHCCNRVSLVNGNDGIGILWSNIWSNYDVYVTWRSIGWWWWRPCACSALYTYSIKYVI